jgi:hypothetical protein
MRFVPPPDRRVTEFRRMVAVTLAVAAAGAVIGAVLAVLSVAGVLLALGGAQRFRVLAPFIFVAGFGGALGFILAPLAAWTLMRYVPLWRALVETALGTAFGLAIGSLVGPMRGGDEFWALLLGLAGFGAAALRLRVKYRDAERAALGGDTTEGRPGTASRLVAISIGAVVLTLASSVVPGTRVEVQDWDCPPAPASCAREVVANGFPFPYISDYHGLSVANRASLSGALLGEDRFRKAPFWANVAVYGGVLAAVSVARHLARRRRRRAPSLA